MVQTLKQMAAVGAEIAKRALAKNIDVVVFDRGGYIYHGRVKALCRSRKRSWIKILRGRSNNGRT